LELSKTHLNKPKSFWENVLWSDKTKLELFGRSHKVYVSRKKKRKNTVPTVKHGAGSLMVWGCLLPLVLGALNLCMASLNQEITKVFGVQRSIQCHKAASLSKLMGSPAGQ
ncbi:hypothetical protein LDENG_00093650, partial [Lucifuga dentata]